MFTEEDIDRLFTHHPPKDDQIPRYVELRDQARAFAHKIVELTPTSAEQTLAIRRLSEAVMLANQAIAVNE